MSARQLAEALTEMGIPYTRTQVTNLEAKRRTTITVSEIFALAAALRVPPLLLLFPLGRADAMTPLPGIEVAPLDALLWAENGSLPGLPNLGPVDSDLIELYREHQQAAQSWERLRREARSLREEAERSERVRSGLVASEEAARSAGIHIPGDPAELRRDADDLETHGVKGAERRLRNARKAIVSRDLQPPPLPAGLRYLDDGLAL